jgi:hypothetical protein
MTPLLLLRSLMPCIQSSFSAVISPFGVSFLVGLDAVEAEKLILGVECADGSAAETHALISKSLKFEFPGELVFEGEKSKYEDETFETAQRHGRGRKQDGQ